MSRGNPATLKLTLLVCYTEIGRLLCFACLFILEYIFSGSRNTFFHLLSLTKLVGVGVIIREFFRDEIYFF